MNNVYDKAEKHNYKLHIYNLKICKQNNELREEWNRKIKKKKKKKKYGKIW